MNIMSVYTTSSKGWPLGLCCVIKYSTSLNIPPSAVTITTPKPIHANTSSAPTYSSAITIIFVLGLCANTKIDFTFTGVQPLL